MNCGGGPIEVGLVESCGCPVALDVLSEDRRIAWGTAAGGNPIEPIGPPEDTESGPPLPLAVAEGPEPARPDGLTRPLLPPVED